MNCEWDNVKNRPQTAEVGFLKTEPRKTEFSVFEFWAQFGSVFRKPISPIFIGFRTPLTKAETTELKTKNSRLRDQGKDDRARDQD